MYEVYNMYGMKKTMKRKCAGPHGNLVVVTSTMLGGLIRPPIARRVALPMLTYRLVMLGHCTAALLEILGGSYGAAYAFRRPLMSQLFYICTSRRGQQVQYILRMSECLMLVVGHVCILFTHHLHVRLLLRVWSLNMYHLKCVAMEDAKASGLIGVRTGGLWCAPKGISIPNFRYHIRKSRPMMVRRAMSPSVTSSRSALYYVNMIYPKQKHVNIGEVGAVCMAALHAAEKEKQVSVRLPAVLDSLVSGFAHAKGRSSSLEVNHELELALPVVLGNDTYTFELWVVLRTRQGVLHCACRVLKSPIGLLHWIVTTMSYLTKGSELLTRHTRVSAHILL